MAKWICKVCGYTHYGVDAPEVCPKCGAPRSQFEEVKPKKGGCLFSVFILAIISAFCLNVWSCDNSKTTVNNAVIKQDFDLNRYLGKWYEIARFDHKFERGLTHCTAEYAFKETGKIKVFNRGIKNGKWSNSTGKAKATDTPGLLRVSFFGPFYSDYRILLLATDYSYALVGSSSDEFLWILSRTPELSPNDCDKILLEAKNRGYDTNKLIWVDHKPITNIQ